MFEVFPAVYSVAPPSLLSFEAWQAAAVLAGGKGAHLWGPSAAYWARLVKERPNVIHVGVRNDLAEVPGIKWHRTTIEPVKHRRMPITPLARIPLDLAPTFSDRDLRGVLAELEFHHDLGPEEVRKHLGKGRTGGTKLRRALDAHTPQLAETRSELEKAYIRFSDQRNLELPAFNTPVGKSTVDAIYEDARVIVELDGVKGHSGERRVLRDHRRDLHRRADGFLPLRYHYSQLLDPQDGDLIEAELVRFGVRYR